MRANAKWSDGTPITVDDLRRTMDSRFVASIADPTTRARTIVVPWQFGVIRGFAGLLPRGLLRLILSRL